MSQLHKETSQPFHLNPKKVTSLRTIPQGSQIYHETKPEIPQFDSPVDGDSLSSAEDMPEGHISTSKPSPPWPLQQNPLLSFLLLSTKSK